MKTNFLISTLFLLCSITSLVAQNSNRSTVKVKGIATDATGAPIAKAHVFVDSLKTGYRTNKKGEFRLRIPSDANFLSIFSEAYGIQSLLYKGEVLVHFTFPKNSEVLTESDLTELGYIFDTDVFRNIGKKSYSEYPDIFQIIREKFSGVRVDGTSIYVRGVVSLQGNQTPLFIVDGNYVNEISFINPDELQSIELLKGEDTALYGARGASGVFIISLK